MSGNKSTGIVGHISYAYDKDREAYHENGVGIAQSKVRHYLLSPYSPGICHTTLCMHDVVGRFLLDPRIHLLSIVVVARIPRTT